MIGDNAVFEVSFYDLPGRRLTLAGATLSRRLDNGRGIWRLEAPRPDGALLELEGLGGPMALPKQIGRALPAFLRGDRPEQFLRLRVHPGDDRNDIEVLEGMPSNGSLVIGPGGLGATVLELVAESAAAADGPIGRLRSVLARQYAEILRHDPGVRLDLDPEDVHRVRVAARRGRAVLRAARPLLDPDWSEPLRAELKWLGGSLGARRDLDVLIARLREQVVLLEQPEQGAAETLVDALEQERATAQFFAVEVLGSPRYFNLLDTLEAAVHGPRVRRSEVSLSTLAAKEFRRLRKAAAAIGPESSDAELHRARILGKRARYAAEFAEPELGKAGRRFVARAKAFQDILGAHQDAIVAEARLRSLLGSTAGPGRRVRGRTPRRAGTSAASQDARGATPSLAEARALRSRLGMIVYLVRHARAGKRGDWEGDDSLRPLDERGRLQAERLVEQLADREFGRILSSRYVRCVQSVEPLAAARGLAVEEDEALAEGAGASAALSVLRAADEPVVACVHGDLCAELLGEKTPKGSTTILELADDSVTVLGRLEPPA